MNEEQKEQALALCDIQEVALCMDRGWLPYVWVDIGIRVPDLTHPSGAVEGVLHRVLEKLVGVPVEVAAVREDADGAPEWAARTAPDGMFFNDPGTHPTRPEAIVAALLALEVK